MDINDTKDEQAYIVAVEDDKISADIDSLISPINTIGIESVYK